VVLTTSALGVVLLWHRFEAQFGGDAFPRVVAAVAVWIVVLTAITCWLPLRLGTRHLERLEI
ncbi:MAG: hypothetical protein AAGF23_15005, partial [Acidobacteriota bacterium]